MHWTACRDRNCCLWILLSFCKYNTKPNVLKHVAFHIRDSCYFSRKSQKTQSDESIQVVCSEGQQNKHPLTIVANHYFGHARLFGQLRGTATGPTDIMYRNNRNFEHLTAIIRTPNARLVLIWLPSWAEISTFRFWEVTNMAISHVAGTSSPSRSSSRQPCLSLRTSQADKL